MDGTATRGLGSSLCRRRKISTASCLMNCVRLFSFTTWMHFNLPNTDASAVTCTQVLQNCSMYGLDCRQKLPMNIMSITSSCMTVFDGSSGHCTDDCNSALQALEDLPVQGWFDCDCQGVGFFNYDEDKCRNVQNTHAICLSPAVADPTTHPPEVTISAITCNQVIQNCNLYGLDCQQRLSASLLSINIICRTLLDGSSDSCSDDCNDKLKYLVEVPVSGWFECDCTNASFPFANYDENACRNIQSRLTVCSNYPAAAGSTVHPPEGKPSTRSSEVPARTTNPLSMDTCSAARLMCERSVVCQAALTRVLGACDPRSSVCTLACAQAMGMLEVFDEADKLWNCNCPWVSHYGENSHLEVAWCQRFSDGFRQECLKTESIVVSVAPSHTQGSKRGSDDPQIGDGGNGAPPSPRIYRPSAWLAVGLTTVLVLVQHVQNHL